MYPVAATAASALVLSLQLLFRAAPVQKFLAKLTNAETHAKSDEDIESSGTDGQSSSHIARLGGPVIFSFKVVRLLSCLTLFALSIAKLIVDDGKDDSRLSLDIDSRWVAFGFIGTYVRLASVNTFARSLHDTFDRLTRPFSRLSPWCRVLV